MKHFNISLLSGVLFLGVAGLLGACQDGMQDAEEDALFVMDGAQGSETTIKATVTLTETYRLEEALRAALGDDAWTTVQELVIKGSFYGKDVNAMQQLSALSTLDMTNAQFKKADGGELNRVSFNYYNMQGHSIPVSYWVQLDNQVFDYTFAGMSQLSVVKLPEVTSIGTRSFENSGVKTVLFSGNLKEITGASFINCNMLEEISLPEGLEKIHSSAFRECENLRKVYLPNSLKVIDSFAFKDCKSLEFINYPLLLTKVSFEAFSETSIKSLIVPEGVTTYVGLTNCIALERVSLPSSLKEIAQDAFHSTRLQTIQIPEGVEKIGNGAFRYCNHLETIILPSSVTEIGDGLFASCSNLKHVKIPSSVIRIGVDIFLYCRSLASVEWDSPLDVEDAQNAPQNCLLYIKSHNGAVPVYGPNWPNIVIDGVCNNIELDRDASFYATRSFAAKHISYSIDLGQWFGSDRYTVPGLSRGWQALTLPFTPTTVKSVNNGVLAPFGSDVEEAKPFWLRSLTADGWVDETVITPNKPHLVAFPYNPDLYPDDYNIIGEVVFEGENVTVQQTPETLSEDEGPDYYLVPLLEYDRGDAHSNEYGHYLLRDGLVNDEFQRAFFNRNAYESIPAFSAYARPKAASAGAPVLPISVSTVKKSATTRGVTEKRKPQIDDM